MPWGCCVSIILDRGSFTVCCRRCAWVTDVDDFDDAVAIKVQHVRGSR